MITTPITFTSQSAHTILCQLWIFIYLHSCLSSGRNSPSLTLSFLSDGCVLNQWEGNCLFICPHAQLGQLEILQCTYHTSLPLTNVVYNISEEWHCSSSFQCVLPWCCVSEMMTSSLLRGRNIDDVIIFYRTVSFNSFLSHLHHFHQIHWSIVSENDKLRHDSAEQTEYRSLKQWCRADVNSVIREWFNKIWTVIKESTELRLVTQSQ